MFPTLRKEWSPAVSYTHLDVYKRQEERARREAVQKELSKYKKPYYKTVWFGLLMAGGALAVGTVILVPILVNAASKTDGGTQHLSFSLTF